MKAALTASAPAALKTPALIVFLSAEDQPSLPDHPELAGLSGLISPRLKQGDFKAKHLEALVLFPEGKTGPERIILVGLGPARELDPAKLRQASAKGVQAARELGLDSAALLMPAVIPGGIDLQAVAETIMLGAFLGGYDFNELKTKEEDKKKPLRSLTLVRTGKMSYPAVSNGVSTGKSRLKGEASFGELKPPFGGLKPAQAKAALELAEVSAQAISYARDLTNRPANLVFPEVLAEEARRLARKYKFKIKVQDMAEAKKRGLGAFVGVAQGSGHPGRIIILEYQGAGRGESPIALLGKAITFDSGGLDLKSAEYMVGMKTDMAGGAVVLAVMAAAAQLKLRLNLVGVVPAAENMPGGKSYRPGDVLTSMSGLTIEVTNTDAEGRLVLADALTLAQTYRPRIMIDLATLTGACAVALGEKCAGLMGNDPGLIQDLEKASQQTGERVWELPMFEDYFEAMKSEVADFSNAGRTRLGGAITAALFLKQFVSPGVKWAHVDIAGPARLEKGSPDAPPGATGFGVHLLINYLHRMR